MRDKINILYYPDMQISHTTLKKCILFFDEIHFMDRPALAIDNFGFIGADSPLRAVEKSFRDAGVPVYVHGVSGGRVSAGLLEKVYTDVGDYSFIENFKQGLNSSPTFKSHQFPEGHYGPFGSNQNELIHLINNIDLSIFKSSEATKELLKKNTLHFDKLNPETIAAFLLKSVSLCSAQLNFALEEGIKYGFTPLADAEPYAKLLGTKYLRAANKLEPAKNNMHISDLSFAIFDELITNECIENVDIKDIVAYRKKSARAREEFIEYLASLQAKQARVPFNGDYTGEINRLIKAEIIPAVTAFRNKLETISESFIGSIVKGTLSELGGLGGLHLFTDISWERIIALTGIMSAYVLNATVDKYLAERSHRRECSISYILSLDKRKIKK